MPTVHAIVPAAGEGARFGGDTPKQWLEVAGRTVLDWSITRLLAVAESVVVAAAESVWQNPPSVHRETPRVRWVCGGATRSLSVRRAFETLRAEPADLVAVHDAARPAVAESDLSAVIAAAEATGAAVLGREVSDTLKRIETGRIVETVERRGLFRAETPQVFRHDLLARAFDAAAAGADPPTDESALVELLEGVEIVAVAARHPNPKLTTTGDLELMSRLLAESA